MAKYRKKSIEVEAWQVGSDEPMPWWIREELGTINGVITPIGDMPVGFAVFDTSVFKDWQAAYRGDYIVREGHRFFVCSKKYFEQTYEAVSVREAGLAISYMLKRMSDSNDTFTNMCISHLCSEGYKVNEPDDKPYYIQVYEWAFSNMEGCDEPEFSMFATICGAIEDYERAVSDTDS